MFKSCPVSAHRLSIINKILRISCTKCAFCAEKRCTKRSEVRNAYDGCWSYFSEG